MTLANGIQGQSSVVLIVEPYVYTVVGNYSPSYSFFPVNGLSLSPAFFYPECPNIKGPAYIPMSVNLGCNLYDAKNNLIKALSGCQIKSNEVQPGLTYYIKYSYTPNPYQTAQKDTITLTTLYLPPTCSIANSSMVYVRTNETLGLKVTLVNPRTAFKFNWACKPLTAGASCGVISSTSSSSGLSLPASTMTLNA